MPGPMIYQISFYAAAASQPMLCLFSFLFCYRRRNPGYMRSFPIYTTLSMVPTFLQLYVPAFEKPSYFIFPQFELLYFAYFLTSIFLSHRAKRLMWSFSILWVIFCVSDLYINLGKRPLIEHTEMATIGESIIIIFGCIEYIRQVMAKAIIPNLSREPAFWMVCATMCYFLALLPTTVFTRFAQVTDHFALGEKFWSVNNFSVVISSCLYITAMLCTKNRRSSLSLA